MKKKTNSCNDPLLINFSTKHWTSNIVYPQVLLVYAFYEHFPFCGGLGFNGSSHSEGTSKTTNVQILHAAHNPPPPPPTKKKNRIVCRARTDGSLNIGLLYITEDCGVKENAFIDFGLSNQKK